MSNNLTEKELNEHYQHLCAQLGDCKYNIRQYEKRMDEIYNQIDALNNMAKAMKNTQENK